MTADGVANTKIVSSLGVSLSSVLKWASTMTHDYKRTYSRPSANSGLFEGRTSSFKNNAS